MPASPTVILTREAADNEALRRELADWEIPVVVYPCLATRYIPATEWRVVPPAPLSQFRVVLITSRRGARALQADRSLALAPGRIIAAVGASTAEVIRAELGREPDLIATDARSLGLAQELAGILQPGEAVLHVRGSKSTGELKSILDRMDFAVHEMVVYRNDVPDLPPLTAPAPWLVVVASPSALLRFVAANGARLTGSRFVAIGPTTGRAVEEAGQGPVYQALSPRHEHLARAVRKAWNEFRAVAPDTDPKHEL
ncbi:MAG: uroporphyrinogen-III synthase [Acidobacteria bacterium]|nr:uroporphyrinogen-III synthase [Acidobacteriota bacterium]